LIAWRDVKLLALRHGGALDRLARGAEDAAKDHVDSILLDELGRLGLCDAVGRRAVLDVEVDLPPQ
jgi:hypothetical protein